MRHACIPAGSASVYAWLRKQMRKILSAEGLCQGRACNHVISACNYVVFGCNCANAVAGRTAFPVVSLSSSRDSSAQRGQARMVVASKHGRRALQNGKIDWLS